MQIDISLHANIVPKSTPNIYAFYILRWTENFLFKLFVTFFSWKNKVTKEIQDKPDRSARFISCTIIFSGLNEYFVFVWPTPPSVWLILLILAYSMLNDNFEFALIY